jgi:membrane protein DedA with SNARE-associated domain
VDVELIMLEWFAGYFVLFAAAGLGLPFPEEVLIVAAGLWTAQHDEFGVLRWLMLPVCCLGVLTADCLLYGVGRRYGLWLLQHQWIARLMPEAKRQRIEDNFHRYGVSILLFGRLVPGIRTPLFLTAGIMRLPVRYFLLADGLGAVLGNSLLFFLAWWFGDAFKELIDRMERDVNALKPALILTALGAFGLYHLLRFLRRPVSTGDPKELPLIGQSVAARIDHEGREAAEHSHKQSGDSVTDHQAHSTHEVMRQTIVGRSETEGKEMV